MENPDGSYTVESRQALMNNYCHQCNGPIPEGTTVYSFGGPRSFEYCSLDCIAERANKNSYKVDYSKVGANAPREDTKIMANNIYSVIVVTRSDDDKRQIIETSQPELVIAPSASQAIINTCVENGIGANTKNQEVMVLAPSYSGICG